MSNFVLHSSEHTKLVRESRTGGEGRRACVVLEFARGDCFNGVNVVGVGGKTVYMTMDQGNLKRLLLMMMQKLISEGKVFVWGGCMRTRQKMEHQCLHS